MAQDIVAATREFGGCERWHLAELGWTRRQLDAYLDGVLDELKAAKTAAWAA